MTPVPELFREAVAALQSVRPRREVLLEPMRAPQRLAPWSYAVSCEVAGPADVLASGRLVLLHDPDGQDGWDGVLTRQRDSIRLAKAVEGLLRNPERRLQLGREAARKIRSRFDVQVCEPIFHNRIRSVIAAASTRK